MSWKSVMTAGMLGRQEGRACLERSQETMLREYNDIPLQVLRHFDVFLTNIYIYITKRIYL